MEENIKLKILTIKCLGGLNWTNGNFGLIHLKRGMKPFNLGWVL